MSIMKTIKSKLFTNILFNKLQNLCLLERSKVKIYKEPNGYILRELDGDKDAVKIIFDKIKNEFQIHILDDMNSTILHESISVTSDKIKMIRELDKSFNLRLLNWDWL